MISNGIRFQLEALTLPILLENLNDTLGLLNNSVTMHSIILRSPRGLYADMSLPN